MTFKDYVEARKIYREKTFEPDQSENLLKKLKGEK
jgi:hypothetical protein